MKNWFISKRIGNALRIRGVEGPRVREKHLKIQSLDPYSVIIKGLIIEPTLCLSQKDIDFWTPAFAPG